MISVAQLFFWSLVLGESQAYLVSYVIEPFHADIAFRQSSNPLELYAPTSGQVVGSISNNNTLNGDSSLRIDYHNEDTGKYVLQSFLGNIQERTPVYFCRGAKALVFSYQHKLAEDVAPESNDLRWVFTLFDSADCRSNCSKPENLEAWEFTGELLATGSTWNSVSAPLDSSQGWSLSSGSGNGALDLDMIKGWRLELISMTNDLAGSVWVDQISVDGDGDMIGAVFHADSWNKSLADDLVQPIYFNSAISENQTSEVLYNGDFYIDYTVQQTETWGGFIQYDFSFPGRSYYNLSRAEAVSMNYHTIRNASVPGRAHVRFLMLDTSHCLDGCGHFSPLVENYYSFHFILDQKDAKGTVSLELKGDANSESPFWRTGWFGIIGNDALDKSHIKGYKIEISVDSQGDMGSLVSGAFELSDLKALEVYDPSAIDTSQCIIEPELRFLQGGSTQFKRIEFLKYSECCDTCTLDKDCNFAYSDGRDCFIADSVAADSVALDSGAVSRNGRTVAFLKLSEDDFCTVCECREFDLTIDCRGKDLVILPSTFTPGEQDPAVPGPPAWMARVLDLRNNPRLVVLGIDAFDALQSLEELRLPSGIAHISQTAILGLDQLAAISFTSDEDSAGNSNVAKIAELANINNAIMNPNESFSNICCGLGKSISLTSSSAVEELTFCDLKPDEPGIDAVFENFTEYHQASLLEAITPSSSFMFEAAENKFKCAEFCNIRAECRYFSYDARVVNTEHVCHLLTDKGTPTKVCCKPEQYEDPGGTLPGWVSGRVPRTRHDTDNARVVLGSTKNLIADESSGYKISYLVSLGSMPLRGAVWVEPKVIATPADGMEVVIAPLKVVLYDNETSAVVEVTVVNAGDVGKGGTLAVENVVQSCDEAFSVEQSNPQVFIDLVLPEEEGDEWLFWIPIVACVAVVAVLALVFWAYFERKRKQADAFWHVHPSELSFGETPKVIGVGSFGYVLLGEYRGTEVAVKRVLPPRKSKRGRSTASLKAHSMFDNAYSSRGPHQRDDPSSGGSHSDADIETGLSAAKWKGTRSGTRSSLVDAAKSYQNMRWRKAFKFNKRPDQRQLREDFISEMRHLSKLRHPCITTVMGAVVRRNEEPMLVMEFMDYGSLYDLLRNETVALEGEQILPILRDVAQGVRFLHSATPQVVHGDIKSRNILVDNRLRAKVADFGLSEKKRLGACGTPFWMAPELLRGETTNTTESDVYAFGITVYEVYSRKDPFDGDASDFATILEKVSDRGINKRPTLPINCPPEIKAIMDNCVNGDLAQRPTFESLDMTLKSMDSSKAQPTQEQVHGKATTERLLDEVFPPHVAKELREGRKVQPESREMVTIVFADIVGFTNLSASMSAMAVSDMLDRLYTKFDEISRKHDVFKVETIGDSWMGVTNLVKDQPYHVDSVAAFSIEVMQAASDTWVDPSNPSFGRVNLRLGFHSGPVVANVVGSRNPRYCLFGDTVNTAARMESHSIPGRIQCSATSAAMLSKQNPVANVIPRGRISVKGKGHMETFWIEDHGVGLVAGVSASSAGDKETPAKASLEQAPPRSTPIAVPINVKSFTDEALDEVFTDEAVAEAFAIGVDNQGYEATPKEQALPESAPSFRRKRQN